MVLRHSKISTSAFTLVELLVVIAIIGILSTLSVVALNSARSKARDARRLSDAKQIGMALEMYLDTKGVYPETPVLSDNGVITGLCISDLGISSTCGADVYLQKIPAGPKKNENYTYFSLHNQSDYRVNFELENNSGGFTAGPLSYSPGGLVRDIYSGLIGWWKFDEISGNIAYDSSGYNHHGNLFGSPAHVPGKINGALSFDGSSQYVANIENPDFLEPQSITVSGWINMSVSAPTGHSIWLSKWYGYSMEIAATTRIPYFRLRGIGDTFSSQALNLGQWQHFVGTYDPSIGGRAYLNGVLVGSRGPGGQIEYSRLVSLNIGRHGGGVYFNGFIDEVRIYNRALSAEEVWALFQDL